MFSSGLEIAFVYRGCKYIFYIWVFVWLFFGGVFRKSGRFIGMLLLIFWFFGFLFRDGGGNFILLFKEFLLFLVF